jgi:hypothetical protein
LVQDQIDQTSQYTASENSPTADALNRVIEVKQLISRAPLPGGYLQTLKRLGIGIVAFIIASIIGVYVSKGGDWLEDQAHQAKQRQQQKEAQERYVEQQYQRYVGTIPADELKELLKEAGSKEEFVQRVQYNWQTRKYYLRRKD